MIFNVAGLLTDQVGATRRGQLAEERLVSGGVEFTGIEGGVTLMRTDRTILVSAEVEATAITECSRCLEKATVEIDLEFEEEFVPLNSDLVGSKWEDGSDETFDSSLLIDDHNQLDLTEAIGQAMAASMPIAPLCRENCKGICPVCWRNRNEFDCECDQLPIDPRWASLASLNPESAKSPE